MTPGCQDTLEQLPEGNLFRFPAAGNAFTLTFYRDAAARAAAQREQLRPAGYEETYDCIACTLVTNGGYLGSSLYQYLFIYRVNQKKGRSQNIIVFHELLSLGCINFKNLCAYHEEEVLRFPKHPQLTKFA